MKIAMVSSSASRAAGGIFEVERRLSLELAGPLGHDVAVFAGADASSAADLPSWLPVQPKIYPCMGPRAFGYCPGMVAGLKAWDPEVAHLHTLWMYPSVAVSRWSRAAGKPSMITLHGMLDAWALQNSAWKKKLALRFYERKNLDQAACIHVLSEAEGRSAREFGLKNPLVVIPNGVDVPDTLPAVEPQGDRRVLLFLGRLHPKKGLMNLIRAWNEVKRCGMAAEWTLVIAGWAERDHDVELRKLADELGLAHRSAASAWDTEGAPLVFLGPQFGRDKERCLMLCDAFVLPSVSEGLPMSVLEAWAYGKPVVMTPMCNLPAGFKRGAALPVEPDVAGLKEGLLKLTAMTDDERRAMGGRGGQLVASQFTWSQVAAQMSGVYHWISRGGEAPACIMA